MSRGVYDEQGRRLASGDNLLNAEQVAEILGVKAAQVKLLAAQGELRAFRLGHRTLRFTRADVDDFVESKSTQPRRRRRRAS